MNEKRILCVEVSGNCRNLREINSLSLASLFNVRKAGSYCSSAVGWKKITKAQCKKCNKAKYAGITREQAIEKMAKGIGWAFDPYKPAKEEYDSIWNNVLLDGTKKHYKDVAGAAFDALLEGKQ